MTEITKILQNIEQGDAQAPDKLLPVVYSELRKLAAARLGREKAAHSPQPTVLVHDAYLRLVDQSQPQMWNGRRHFFGAAAEAMRRILVEHARRKRSIKRGGKFERVELDEIEFLPDVEQVDLIALDEALTDLEATAWDKARLVKLRFFVGLSVPEAAEAMGISVATAERYWKFARTWLYARLYPEK